jgi:hypothetical protein
MSEVLAFPGTNWRDIAGLAREFADRVESGDLGDITRVALVIDSDLGLRTLTWGENAAPLYWMGMYQAASNMAYAEGLDEE